MVDANVGDKVDEFRVKVGSTLVQDHVLDDLLVVLLLRLECDRLEQTLVCLLRHLEVRVVEEVSGEEIFLLTCLPLSLRRDR